MNHNAIAYPAPGRPADAIANIRGGRAHPGIRGNVLFYRVRGGVIVRADIRGLPAQTDACKGSFLGFHIHTGSRCSGNAEDSFADAGTHYNPYICPHPQHAGDLPPLLCAAGSAFSMFLTDRFTVREIIGRTVIIHSSPDDFTTQPAGNAGEKLACGVIMHTLR